MEEHCFGVRRSEHVDGGGVRGGAFAPRAEGAN